MDLLIGQHGAVTRASAVARLGEYEVRRGIETGRWLSPWRGVLIEPRRADDPLTLAAAAVALGGPAVVLAGPTAAHLHGITAVTPTPIHVMTPYGLPLRSRRGLVVHNGAIPEIDRTVVDGLPVLGFERTVTDLACTASPAEALAVLDQALGSVEAESRERLRATLADRLIRRRDPRGTRRAARLLDTATGRAESPAESWLLWRVVDSGFPVPEVNLSLAGIDGRERYRLDLAWPRERIAIEYYGYAAHAERTDQDELRATDVRRRGWTVIEVWAEDLVNPARFLAELEEAFARRGIDMAGRSARVLRDRRHRER